MIKLKDILLEIKNNNFEYAYHAGPRKINVKDIVFDISSLGFHVGTLNQAQWIASGKHKKGFNLPISKYKVFDFVGNLDKEEVPHDMAWEHADILLVEFVHDGIFNESDAHILVNLWNDLDDYSIEELHKIINIANRNFGNENFNSMDSFDGVNLNPDVYKNKEKLSQIRKLLVEEYDIGAIEYTNEVEGNLSDKSICILDKSMIQDI
jgi:hypothetical protein